MKRDRYHAELTRLPPDHLADMIIKLRQENSTLKRIVTGLSIVGEILPHDYVMALSDCYWIAHGKPSNRAKDETPGRSAPASRAPSHNPEAYRIWREEWQTMNGKTSHLLRATETSVRFPYGRRVSDKGASQSHPAA